MKRGIFIVLFILVSLLLVYSGSWSLDAQLTGESIINRPTKCTGNNLEYADGAEGEIINLGECPYGCTDNGNGLAHCNSRPEQNIPSPQLTSSSGGGGGCTRRSSGGDATPSENDIASCNGEIPAEYLYDGLRTQGWKFKVTSGVPRLLVPRLNLETQQSDYAQIYAIEHPASINLNSEECKYYYFAFQRERVEISEDLQNLPDQTYIDEIGTEHCVYDISEFRNRVAGIFFGAAAGSAKLAFPDKVNTHEPNQETNIINSDGLYVRDEKLVSSLTSDVACGDFWQETFSFIDSQGVTVKHCVLREEFSIGEEFTYNSYLVNTSVYDATDICNGGGIVSGVPFRSANNQFSVLCVDKKVVENEKNLIINSLIAENNCPEGFTKTNENINLGAQQIAHCISSTTSFDKSLERNAKQTESFTSLEIDVCPDLVEGMREDTCDGGCCPTQSCEAAIPEGPLEYFGFTFEPSNNCLIDEANKDSSGVGLPITNEVDEQAQSWLEQCMERYSEHLCDSQIESIVMEADDSSELVARNNEPAIFHVKTDGDDGLAFCKMEMAGEVEFPNPTDAAPGNLPGEGGLDMPFPEYETIAEGQCDAITFTPSIPESSFSKDRVILPAVRFSASCDNGIDISTKDVTVCTSIPSPRIGRGEDICKISCDELFTKLKEINADEHETIDFESTIENTWDIVQHDRRVDYFPGTKDIYLTLDANVDNYNLNTKVPEVITITIDIQGSKRDINWFLGEDEYPFITLRREIINILREKMPRMVIDSSDTAWMSPVVADYFLEFQSNIEGWINSFDLPGTDDSVWIKNKITFTFIQLSKIGKDEVMYTTLDGYRTKVTGESLESWYDLYGKKEFIKQGINPEYPFVITVDETLDFYDYNNRANILQGSYAPTRSLYLPRFRLLGHERYVPVPWERIKQEDPSKVLISLENSPKLVEPFKEENGDAISTHDTRLQLIKDIIECENAE